MKLYILDNLGCIEYEIDRRLVYAMVILVAYILLFDIDAS